jgi:type IV pilus assembly protein PilQ
MSKELGLNTVISETVVGRTTVVLRDVPPDQVLDIIFKQKGLDMRKEGNVIRIAFPDEFLAYEKMREKNMRRKSGKF